MILKEEMITGAHEKKCRRSSAKDSRCACSNPVSWGSALHAAKERLQGPQTKKKKSKSVNEDSHIMISIINKWDFFQSDHSFVV